MPCENDHLQGFIRSAGMLVRNGYYAIDEKGGNHTTSVPSLVRSLEKKGHLPIMAEVKIASPSKGPISDHLPDRLVDGYLRGGADAISVLTEPIRFHGSISNLRLATGHGVPVMMKDFIMHEEQLLCARCNGASAALIIESAFGEEGRSRRDALIDFAHGLGLEVVIEASNDEECDAIMGSDADILAYNRRDLRTLGVSDFPIDSAVSKLKEDNRKTMAFSMLNDRDDMIRMRDLGVDAVLLGTTLSGSRFPYEKLLTMKVMV